MDILGSPKPHRALGIPEIMDLVFKESIVDDRQGLARWAQSCKAFCNPALSILWKRMPSILPLLKLLPPFQYKEEEILTLCLQFERGLQEDDWKRFDVYAWRIHELNCGVICTSHTAESIYDHLAQWREGPYFLPSLHSVTFPTYASIAYFAPLLISPHIRRINVLCTNDGFVTFPPLLHTLLAGTPLLEHLEIYCGNFSSASYSHITRLRSLIHLELCFYSLSTSQDGYYDDFITPLSTLKHLTTLKLSNLELSAHVALQCKGFESLEVLLLAGRASFIMTFMDNVVSTRLHKLTFAAYFSRDEWIDVATWFGTCLQSHSSLCSLHFRIRPNQNYSLTPVALMSVIRPMLSLSQLERLRLDVSGDVTLSDGDLHMMASAWPKIVVLQLVVPLQNCSPQSLSDYPSIQSLISLAALCPKLQTLHIFIAFGIIDIPISPLPCHGLQFLTLNLLYPRALPPLPFSRALNSLFPLVWMVEYL